jgi:hypothetical protein
VPSAALPAARLTRARLFGALFLLASLNAFFGNAAGSVAARGWTGAIFNLFDISAILWAALAAGLLILAEEKESEPWRRNDAALAAAVIAAALLPAPVASALALTLAAGWAIATGGGGDDRGSALRRSGIVFLALTGGLLWGRLLLTYFSRPLLDIDALFVTGLIGGEQSGNVIWSNATGARIIVAAGCSSMRGLSLALVFWATVNQYYRVRFDARAILTCVVALAATVAINVARIAAMLRWPAYLEEIHHGWGWLIAMWTNLALIVLICVFGARREIFAR